MITRKVIDNLHIPRHQCDKLAGPWLLSPICRISHRDTQVFSEKGAVSASFEPSKTTWPSSPQDCRIRPNLQLAPNVERCEIVRCLEKSIDERVSTSYQSHTWHHLKIQIHFRSTSIVESITSLLMTTTCWWIVRKGKPWHTLEPSWWVSQRYECEAKTQNTSSLNYGDGKNSRSLERQVLYSNTWNRTELDIWYTMYD